MKLGAFSVSLNVTDVANSRDFYGKFGFEVLHGDGNPILVDQQR
ncbi:VOC family protein [Yoonia sp.]